jgi:hypothetical protein
MVGAVCQAGFAAKSEAVNNMENPLAKDAAKAWFPYFYGRLAMLGPLILAVIIYDNISTLEAGEVESVSMWVPIARLYEIGGFWCAMLLPLVIAITATAATLRYRKIYIELRRQVPDHEFKSALRNIEKSNADESHVFGGKKTTAKQFLTVLIIGIAIAAVFFAWLINTL